MAKRYRLISSPWALPYFYAALSRGDLSYVAGEFRIFGAIFLEDGCSLG
jgi:hypothetical protein